MRHRIIDRLFFVFAVFLISVVAAAEVFEINPADLRGYCTHPGSRFTVSHVVRVAGRHNIQYQNWQDLHIDVARPGGAKDPKCMEKVFSFNKVVSDADAAHKALAIEINPRGPNNGPEFIRARVGTKAPRPRFDSCTFAPSRARAAGLLPSTANPDGLIVREVRCKSTLGEVSLVVVCVDIDDNRSNASNCVDESINTKVLQRNPTTPGASK